MDYQRRLEQDRALVEQRLGTFFPGEGLEEAMRYSLMAGGKRIRPILTLEFCRAAGGEPEEAMDFACAVEMLHTYSLIHDDLPCMDNDDLRRGKPTCHKKFGECTAVLAGDALQAAAFRTVLSAGGQRRHGGGAVRAMAGRILAQAAGELGMCAGQFMDTTGDGGTRTLEELAELNEKKTGALLGAACMLGVAASMGSRAVDDACMDAAGAYAGHLGAAFQIRDDILDVTGGLGRPAGSDAANGKTTFVTLLGVEKCAGLVLDYTRRAKEALDRAPWPGDTAFLRRLADELAVRRS